MITPRGFTGYGDDRHFAPVQDLLATRAEYVPAGRVF
jgi:hypothetical protein